MSAALWPNDKSPWARRADLWHRQREKECSKKGSSRTTNYTHTHTHTEKERERGRQLQPQISFKCLLHNHLFFVINCAGTAYIFFQHTHTCIYTHTYAYMYMYFSLQLARKHFIMNFKCLPDFLLPSAAAGAVSASSPRLWLSVSFSLSPSPSPSLSHTVCLWHNSTHIIFMVLMNPCRLQAQPPPPPSCLQL